MEVNVNTKVFCDAFSVCLSSVHKSPKEIFNNVCLVASGATARLSAQDGENGINVDIPVDVVQPGTVLLPMKTVSDILRESNSDDVSIVLNGTTVRLSSGKCQYDIPTANPEEFPMLNCVSGNSFQVAVEELKASIASTVFCCDVDSSRYALGGVRLEESGDGLAMVGSDGRRLAVSRLAGGEKLPIPAIIPQRSALSLMKILDSGVAIVTVGSNDVQVCVAGITFVSRQVEGRFPSWSSIIPNKSGRSVIKTTVGVLLRAVKQASIVSDKESRGIAFSFGIDTVSIKSNTTEKGSAEICIPVEGSSEAVVIMDYQFVTDFLRTLAATDTICLFVADGSQSVLFESAAGMQYVVMPMDRP